MHTPTQMSQYFSRQGKGQRKKEAQAGCRVHGPALRTLATVHMRRTRWRVEHTLFLGHLHTWKPCTWPGVCRAMLGTCHSYAWWPQYAWPSWSCRIGRHRLS